MTEGAAPDAALRDYIDWHAAYDVPGSRLHLRLLVVQDLIAEALDELPPGPIRMISMCAGQGRDILTVTRRHRRGGDVAGRLVELEPSNAAAAAGLIEDADLRGIEVLVGDAGTTDSYADAVPADLVLACGVFGNISDHDIENTIKRLPTLCAPDAWFIWTRYPSGEGFERIPRWLEEAGLAMRSLVVVEREEFSVGSARLEGPAAPFDPGQHLFSFFR